MNFKSSYEDLLRFISLVEKHKLLINISSMTCYRIRPKNKSKEDKKFDVFAVESLLDVKIRLEYVKFL